MRKWYEDTYALSQTMKFNTGQITRKVHFHKFGGGKTRQCTIFKKMRTKVYVSGRLSLVSHVSVILQSKLGRENMVRYIVMTQISGKK